MKGEMASILCNYYGHYPFLQQGRCICQNCKVALTIVVNGGDVFFGTASQWRDCIFVNASLGRIGEYCEDRGWKLEYREEVRAS